MPRLAIVVVSVVAFAGCRTNNPQSCELDVNKGTPACSDAGNGGPCTSNADCADMATFPVCDTTASPPTCVQCTASDHASCTGTTPICENNSCVACVADNDCGTGGLCLPNGACAAADNIIHAVAMSGSVEPDCGSVGNACTLTAALAAVDATKNVIKLAPGTYTPEMKNFVVSSDVTIDARDAILHKRDNGPILTVSNGKTTTIFGGTIEGATGTNGDGIQCNTATLTVHGTTIQMDEESAIEATNCTLTAIGAEIRSNSKSSSFPGIQSSGGSLTILLSSIVSNLGGGISVNNNGTFQIVGNVFLDNGETSGNVGGLSINSTGTGNRLEFNTITQNKSNTNLAAGVQCILTGFTAENNIIYNNNASGTQVSGTCSHAYSDIGPTFAPSQDDHDNVTNDPSFVNATSDLHLQPGTPIRGKANPAADLTGIASKDLDGNVRVAPATPGAYVAPPQ